jgi:hypothetical protein
LTASGQPFPLAKARRKKIKSDEDRDWIGELYQQGATLDMLAEDYSVTRATIVRILDGVGVKRRAKWQKGAKYAIEDVENEYTTYTVSELTKLVGTAGTWRRILESNPPELETVERKPTFWLIKTKLTKTLIKNFYKKNLKNRWDKKDV